MSDMGAAYWALQALAAGAIGLFGGGMLAVLEGRRAGRWFLACTASVVLMLSMIPGGG